MPSSASVWVIEQRGVRRGAPRVSRTIAAVSEATRKLIEAYDDAWNRQDLAALCAFHADDIVFENHTAGERVEGAEAVRAHIGGIFERWPSLRFRGRRFYAAEDFAVSEWTATATRPDGTQIEWDGVDVFPLHDGKIVRKDVYSSSHAPGSFPNQGKRAANLEAFPRTPRASTVPPAADTTLHDREPPARCRVRLRGHRRLAKSRARSLSPTPMPSSEARRTVEPPSRVTESVKVAP